MKIKFNDSERMYNIEGFRHRKNPDIIIIKGDDLPEKNDSGFVIFYDDFRSDDCSNYVYKWNVITELEPGIMMFTDNPDNVETEDNLAELYLPKPISKEEMTELQRQALLQAKSAKVQESKDKLSEYLSTHPLISTAHGGNEGFYSVTMEKQNLIKNRYVDYQIEKMVNSEAKLYWNETGKSSEEWSEEDFTLLMREIKSYTDPLAEYQRELEETIRNCQDINKINEIEFEYNKIQDAGN